MRVRVRVARRRADDEPMMGRMTKPTKDWERPRPAAAPWVERVSRVALVTPPALHCGDTTGPLLY